MTARDTQIFQNAAQIAEQQVRQARREQAQLFRDITRAAARLIFRKMASAPARDLAVSSDAAN
ncbi:MAG: hypothetical protein KJO42_15990 [Silicimonas sp.]|nr:hypothetical protein [Silicimonas sp.]NNF92459.1 hypothetical protein [Boseongicola sp.]RZW03855.1 MAG: hypothetical protein EX266_11035 [Paracoccaceae bacterium]NND20051.1 hypothetical protein [Silicimonas sp.]NND21506.1 hypothetical protein [Silicimonas sp.]